MTKAWIPPLVAFAGAVLCDGAAYAYAPSAIDLQWPLVSVPLVKVSAPTDPRGGGPQLILLVPGDYRG